MSSAACLLLSGRRNIHCVNLTFTFIGNTSIFHLQSWLCEYLLGYLGDFIVTVFVPDGFSLISIGQLQPSQGVVVVVVVGVVVVVVVVVEDD